MKKRLYAVLMAVCLTTLSCSPQLVVHAEPEQNTDAETNTGAEMITEAETEEITQMVEEDILNPSYEVIDCTQNYTIYGVAVSALNNAPAIATMSTASEEEASSEDEDVSCRVLIKANTEMDFSAYKPLCVIAGPEYHYTMQLGSVADAERAVTELSQDSRIEYAEQDQMISLDPIVPEPEMSTDFVPNLVEETSSISHNSWGCSATQVDSLIGDCMNRTTDNTVVVAVIDSGVDYTHTYLKDHMYVDGEGTLVGYDYVGNDTDPQDENDSNYHGTHCAGTIVDCTQGLDVEIMAVRVMGADGKGYVSNVVSGIEYAVAYGAKVINLSLGGTADNSCAMGEAIRAALQANITVCVAAGNENANTSTSCPAHLGSTDGVITVAAIDDNYNRASYSNYGSEVDVCAPGSNIYSCKGGESNGYQMLSGTSMATPHVSAYAAMLLLEDPSLTPEEVESKLKASCIDLGAEGCDNYYGVGLPQMENIRYISVAQGQSISVIDRSGDHSESSIDTFDNTVVSVNVTSASKESTTSLAGVSADDIDLAVGYYISDGYGNYLKCSVLNVNGSSGTLEYANTTDVSIATKFYLRGKSSSMYEIKFYGADNVSWQLPYTWYYTDDSGLYYEGTGTNTKTGATVKLYEYFELKDQDSWQIGYDDSLPVGGAGLYQYVTIPGAVDATEIVFTGTGEGSASGTIGNVNYTVSVEPQEVPTMDFTSISDVDAATKEAMQNKTSVSGVTVDSYNDIVNAAKESAETTGNSEFLNALESAGNATVKVSTTVKPTVYSVSGDTKNVKYDLSAQATITAGAVSMTMPISNDLLDQTENIVVSLYTGFDPAQLIHRDSDGDMIEKFSETGSKAFTYDDTTGVCTMTIHHFSTLEASDVADATVAVIGSTGYSSVATALGKATEGETVRLVMDTGSTGNEFRVQKGITLDLNGYALTAKTVAVFDGDIIDSADGQGSLVISSNMLAYTGDMATYLPVYNENAYRFIAASPVAEWDKGNAMKVFYGLLNTAASDYQAIQMDSSVKIGFRLTYTLSSGNTMEVEFDANSATLQDYLDKQITTGGYAMYTSLITGEGITLTSAQPYIYSGNIGLKLYGTVAAAAQ